MTSSTKNIAKRLLIGKHPKRTLQRIALLTLLTTITCKHILTPALLDGKSMEPTYHDRQLRFINRLAYYRHEPQRGDVIAIPLAGKKTYYLKRIIALPQETIAIHQGTIQINGQTLNEPYPLKPGTWNMPPQTVPPSHYYVIGDNRDNPIKAHRHGIVQRTKIAGRIL